MPLTGAAGDYDGLLDRIGDRRFVLLGEATHGTHDFYRERARITRRLIEELGFTAVAVEADWPDAYRVNRFVLGLSADPDARAALADFDQLRIGFAEPAGCEVLLDNPGGAGESVQLLRGGSPLDAPGLEAGIDQIAELAVPFDALGVAVDGPVHFFVEVLEGGQSRDRAPREGTINLTRPSPDFERIMWDV